MLKKLYQLLRPEDANSPLVLSQDDHSIHDDDISRAAIRVIEQLHKVGHSAYLVGGCVRDLLLDGHPKDFDVATDATPEEIKNAFGRNARIIGRRFKIVHVRYGREVIEVTTFRGSPKNTPKQSNNKNADHNQSDKGILLRDNVYGDIRSDALRRDFTVNALYYAIDDGAILDYTDGLNDLDNRELRLIGDPDARYKEDPVRMLRAVRFAAKLGFSITPETEKPIYEHADYLADIPPARLFEEVLKLFMSGYATATLTKLREFGLFHYLFPGTEACLSNGSDFYQKLIFAAVTNTDKRIRAGKRVTPAFIYAAMLWPPLVEQMKILQNDYKMNVNDAFQQASQGIISQQMATTSIPKRFLFPMRDIWSLQFRLPRREGKRAEQLVIHQRFRAAYDFLLLREQAGEQLEGLGLWWTRYQDADNETRQKMVSELSPNDDNRPRKPRRRRPKKRPTDAPSNKSPNE